jgi:hypothetical protein
MSHSESAFSLGQPNSGQIFKIVLVFFGFLLVFFAFCYLGFLSIITFEIHAKEAQTAPSYTLNRVREYESAQLHRWGWINKQRGIVQIPIEAAKLKVVGKYSEQ